MNTCRRALLAVVVLGLLAAACRPRSVSPPDASRWSIIHASVVDVVRGVSTTSLELHRNGVREAQAHAKRDSKIGHHLE